MDENFLALKQISVLYVEDEVEIREVLSEMLKRYFKQVHEAADGKEGLVLYEKFSPDLVITDLKLPKLHGIDFAKKIREMHPEVPIVFVTSYDDTHFLQEAIRLKVEGYIIKPIRSNELLEVCHKAVSSLLAKQALAEKDELMMRQSRQAAMGEMISMIAHQWRQPLNTLALLNGKLLILSEKGVLTRESLEETVKKGEEIISKMSGTIDDFRNFFKPNKERVDVRFNTIMRSVRSLIGKPLEYAGIDLIDQSVNDVEFRTYPNELCQIILNLINNAQEAFGDSAPEEKVIIVKASKTDREVVIIVEDNAGGIPGEVMKKAFEPYFTTKGVAGTGLGLYMSKMIIERSMQGTIEIDNIAKGAQCRITLPLEFSD